MKDRILDMLAEICEDGIVKEDLDISLFEHDLLDSLSFTELLVTIETEFGVIISPSEVTREEFGTPNQIISMIEARSK
ncbi:MAG: D-alanine--poly(phosphoribitol) ligase subunit 2 [Anaerovorax sp.]